jgi:hypothetical protein
MAMQHHLDRHRHNSHRDVLVRLVAATGLDGHAAHQHHQSDRMDASCLGGVNDGFAIQWLAGSPADQLQPGGQLTGLSFLSPTSPTVMFGNSQPFPATPTLTSVIYTGAPFSDAGDTFEVTPLCFLPGTQIRTIRGEVAVEMLVIDDLVITSTGAKRRIKWIGIGKMLATTARRNAATPVIVRKSALEDNVPCRDLHVTKGHSLYLDGALIPVEHLINHRTILWDDRAQEVTLYHIELETHECCWRMARPPRATVTTATDGCSKTTTARIVATRNHAHPY